MSYPSEPLPTNSPKNFDVLYICGIVASVIFLVSCFLPYYVVSILGYSESVSIFQGSKLWGIFIIVLGLAGIGTSVVRNGKAFLSVGSAGLGVTIYIIFRLKSTMNAQLGSSASLVKSMLSYGIGFYLLLVGAIAMTGIGAFAMYKSSQDK